jgi:competence protein ComEC
MNQATIKRFGVILALLALIVLGAENFSAAKRHTTLRYWLFDVGQGDAMMLETPQGDQVLIDGGPDDSITQELSHVMSLNDKDIDLVIVSHNHADHLTGIVEVLKRYTVHKIWISGAIHTTDTYRKFLEEIKKNQIPTEIVKAGTKVTFHDLAGIVLFPFEKQTGKLPDNQHDANIVTYWQFGQQSILAMGDAGIEHEQQLLARGLLRRVTILKVGHHGSATSTSAQLLAKTLPKIAVIQVGAHNRYGHPAPATLKRLTDLKIPILRTDQLGTIRFDITFDNFTYASGY